MVLLSSTIRSNSWNAPAAGHSLRRVRSVDTPSERIPMGSPRMGQAGPASCAGWWPGSGVGPVVSSPGAQAGDRGDPACRLAARSGAPPAQPPHPSAHHEAGFVGSPQVGPDRGCHSGPLDLRSGQRRGGADPHERVVEQLEERFGEAARLLDKAEPDLLAFATFPHEHWRQIWSSRP